MLSGGNGPSFIITPSPVGISAEVSCYYDHDHGHSPFAVISLTGNDSITSLFYAFYSQGVQFEDVNCKRKPSKKRRPTMAIVRSPNYPNIGLPAALERVRKVQALEGQNEVSRESFTQVLGNAGLNGPSAKMLSSLAKYGLVSKAGSGEIKVSDLAMDILYGETDQKEKALRQAANSPVLFAEINEKWPERQPSDENLRSFLARKGYSVKVLDQVIGSYRETMSLVSTDNRGYTPRQSNHPEKSTMPTMQQVVERAVFQPPIPTGGFDIGFVGSAIRMNGVVSTKKEAAKVIQALTALQALLPDETSLDPAFADDDPMDDNQFSD